MSLMNWPKFQRDIKKKYLNSNVSTWWGDDIDVRYYLISELQKIVNSNVLDIGTNIGIIIGYLDNSNELHGIDIDEECLVIARKNNPHAIFLNASIFSLPYLDASFDVVVMANVFPYYEIPPVDNIDKFDCIMSAFNEIHRVLKPKGVIYLTTPNGEFSSYIGKRVSRVELVASLEEKFKLEIFGWNYMDNISNNPLVQKILHPKLVCRFSFVWRWLIRSMNHDTSGAKYFYVIAQKI